ncbi:DUF3984 domain-containing protein [Pleurostoma richardsiae]|uniref:DUF3984 domain-containing protein n=1 Tax=Pleurostoma richardsiae TaxID=41990 RepID=A0AA38RA40_9PEZI|nr:DUF3984 domain-containing protein [Pleurostoma richardsiae]
MDAAFNQHQARRKNRSTTNLNHLSLAPLTSKLPLTDPDALPTTDNNDERSPSSFHSHHYRHSTSYLQGKSAPTTPGLLSHSPARSSSHARHAFSAIDDLPKRSKSATHLAPRGRQAHSPATAASRRRRRKNDEAGGLSASDRNDSDWLLRAGALISSETRESKGQSWLASRASSTSLTGMHREEDDDQEAEGDEDGDPWVREREAATSYSSRRASRRGSLAFAEEETSAISPAGSRLGSRSHSRVGRSGGSRSHPLTPLERHSAEGYFSRQHGAADEEQHLHPGPDFVNLDEKLEAVSEERDTSQEDEVYVRRLVKSGGPAGVGSWFGNMLGWKLFSVDEDGEEEESSDEDGEDGTESGDGAAEDAASASTGRRASSVGSRFEGVVTGPDERIPPPKADEGGWQDAAWLLTVASKVLL